ncbi:MAG: lysine-sensitive aspartokinase 3 [Vicinamibacterales bacterium]
MVVQKFGGTSVADADAIRRLIEIVRAARLRDGRGPAVVVSAMSKVTDTLLAIAAHAGAGRMDEALGLVEQLRQRHLKVAGELAPAAGDLAADISAELDGLGAIVRALAVLREVSPRTLDVIAAMGELLSSRVVAAALDAAGIPSAWIDARQAIVTDAEHTRALPLGAETNAAIARLIVPVLDRQAVPVAGGFVGATVDGHTTTLGRGGSDFSGALVGAGIGAREIQIWTDVDGMLTADPRVVAEPRLVPHLSFDEAAELAYFGAKVLHPSTILPAVERNIPVRILNSRNPGGTGTIITAQPPASSMPLAGLASKRDVTVVDITSSRMLMAYGFLRRVFEIFERFTTAVDVVATSEVTVSVTIDDLRNLDAIVAALSEFATVTVERDMALLCAVGDRLRNEPEIAARAVGLLEEVPLRMISQAASRRNITVILRQADLPQAMHRLHEEFFG